MIFSEEAYKEALEELYRISPSVQKVGFAADSYKPGLEGMKALDSATGSPSEKIRCIHVAGTNGKGSVCSMLAASLAAEGLRVGLYTSPHLLDFRERIKIISADGFNLIPKTDVWDYLQNFRDATKGRSFFEVTTGMAFSWFAAQRVDIAVIETGLGGKLDSTNIITPEISVITSIGLDHCALLGGTRAAIAAEKAGIFKKDVPALVWGHDDETDTVFEAAAEKVGCPLHFASPCGPADNAATVLDALRILGRKPNLEAISDFRRKTGLRGRFETLSLNPDIICDIGHNPAALDLNFRRIEALGKPLTIVYGVMADKDYRTNISLFPRGARCILTAPDCPRALPAAALADTFREIRPDLSATVSGSVAEGVREAVSVSSPDSIIFICGSTFVVSEAVSFIENR